MAGLGWILALAAFLQWLGGMTFVLNTWSRVKER
jgi:Trk-type K+ transport system membrane component